MRGKSLARVVALLLAWSSVFARDLPDPKRTPREINPDVTQANIHQTLCVIGWTKTMRPPTSYTNKLKVEQIKEYRYKDNQKCGARIKDVVETTLKRLACDDKLSLANAQKAIATNWVTAYKRYVNREGCPDVEDEQYLVRQAGIMKLVDAC